MLPTILLALTTTTIAPRADLLAGLEAAYVDKGIVRSRTVAVPSVAAVQTRGPLVEPTKRR